MNNKDVFTCEYILKSRPFINFQTTKIDCNPVFSCYHFLISFISVSDPDPDPVGSVSLARIRIRKR